jgi:hypothetical protein
MLLNTDLLQCQLSFSLWLDNCFYQILLLGSAITLLQKRNPSFQFFHRTCNYHTFNCTFIAGKFLLNTSIEFLFDKGMAPHNNLKYYIKPKHFHFSLNQYYHYYWQWNNRLTFDHYMNNKECIQLSFHLCLLFRTLIHIPLNFLELSNELQIERLFYLCPFQKQWLLLSLKFHLSSIYAEFLILMNKVAQHDKNHILSNNYFAKFRKEFRNLFVRCNKWFHFYFWIWFEEDNSNPNQYFS